MNWEFYLPKKRTPFFFPLLFSLAASAQITKGNWLSGGSADYSSTKYSGDLGSGTILDFRVSGKAGHFVHDKIVCGLTPNLIFNKVKQFNNQIRSTAIFLGVFARYYLLPPEQQFNVFTEGDFTLGRTKGSGPETQKAHRYSVAIGPVVFLNSSIGLELSLGYSQMNFSSPGNVKNEVFYTGIGLQFYLERDSH